MTQEMLDQTICSCLQKTMYQELGIFATSTSFKFDPIGPKSVFRMIVEFILVCVDQPSFESSDCILYRWKHEFK